MNNADNNAANHVSYDLNNDALPGSAAPRGLHAVASVPPRPLPYGLADYFWDDAARRKELEFTLFELYQRWGYTLVIPPTFEYADTFYARADTDFQNEMYRFPDKDGTMLALRPEMTIPLARLVATRLHDLPMPQRYCYMGSVFRYIEPRAGRQREFFQAGVELIGAVPPEADAEVVAITAAAVEAAHIDAYQLVLGQLGYFDGLVHDLALKPADAEMLRQAIDRNSDPQLSEFLTNVPLRTQQRRTLEALPALRGRDPLTVIANAERHCLNHRMYSALADLRAICHALEGYGLLDRVYVDLTEIHNLGYYTGLSFEVLTPQTGFALGSGGRYDNLLASFGHNRPAVGAALGLDRLLHAHALQQHTASHRHPLHPQILFDTRQDPASLRYVNALRAHGLRVATQLKTDATTTGATLSPAASPGPHTSAPNSIMDGAQQHVRWTGTGFAVGPTGQDENLRQFAAEEISGLLDYLSAIFFPQDQKR